MIKLAVTPAQFSARAVGLMNTIERSPMVQLILTVSVNSKESRMLRTQGTGALLLRTCT